ncbi:hypothetical protein C0991_010248, partial [Blastosporella zonata]
MATTGDPAQVLPFLAEIGEDMRNETASGQGLEGESTRAPRRCISLKILHFSRDTNSRRYVGRERAVGRTSQLSQSAAVTDSNISPYAKRATLFIDTIRKAMSAVESLNELSLIGRVSEVADETSDYEHLRHITMARSDAWRYLYAPQLETVQAMGLMVTYHCFGDNKYSAVILVFQNFGIIVAFLIGLIVLLLVFSEYNMTTSSETSVVL